MALGIVDKLIDIISSSTPKKIIFFTTIFVLVGSVPLVYFTTLLFGVLYTNFLLILSILLPLLLTPITIALLIKLTKNLSYFKLALAEEIEKNKTKDLMLFEQARFVLMGEIIQNLSHQWKQPLNTINLAILNVRMDSKFPIESEKYFDIMESNVGYLAATIDDFMSFFDKRTYLELKPLDVIIKEVKSIIAVHVQNKKIELSIEIEPNLDDICVASSISQVLLNLINNSKDALLEQEGEKKIALHFYEDATHLHISCSDNGKGITKENQEKIFQPYFTTKSKTQGTGIGLYMSKQIMQKIFYGDLVLKSSTPSKTSFVVSLPYGKNCQHKGSV